MRISHRGLAGALCVLPLLVVGCTAKPAGPPSGPASSPASVSPSDPGPAVITDSSLPSDSTEPVPSLSLPASASATVADSGQPSSIAGAPAGYSPCAAPFMKVGVRPATARDAHAGYLVSFTNTGEVGCTLAGYPDVRIVVGGSQLKAAPTPYGYLGGVRRGAATTLLVASGQHATALLEGEQVNLAGSRCPASSGMVVVPPPTGSAFGVRVASDICGGVQIHPVVASASGTVG